MAEDRHYMSVGPDSKGRGLLAVISRGSPQKGDTDVLVCDVKVVVDMEEARAWYHQMMIERPWEQRQ